MSSDYPLLETISDPADLRALTRQQLVQLATELRAFLIESVARTGGHLAANLGTVELAIALHYVFDTPNDRLVWDVGHQSYPHKILTGRRGAMTKLRQHDGIAGFPRRSESPFDVFGVGHSSTSISAALGMAMAAAASGDPNKTIAVIGDGAMTAGMAFEALNHAGDVAADLLVILNDNEMSISRNVGGLSRYLGKILAGRFYASMREGGKKVLSAVPSFMELARRAEEHMKGMVVPGTLFEELGFNYIGPIDGHDLPQLIRTLRNVRHLEGPRFLHVVTQKGKGYAPAEDNPCAFHGVSKFDPALGPQSSKTQSTPTYTEVFGDWICDRAAQDPRLMAITPAMREGSGLVTFSQRFPERFTDTGIAEQHAVTLAAGMACGGMKPVLAIYSTFLQRGYDQFIHDVALQNLPVMLAIDRAGLVGPDGPTHAGSFDLSYLRCIPNIVVMAPADENECRRMLDTAYEIDGPSAVRYPRGRGPGVAVEKQSAAIEIGRAEVRRRGRDVALLAFGSMVSRAAPIAETLDATLINMRFVKPLDAETIVAAAGQHRLLVTVEENAVSGGAGSAVAELLHERGLAPDILHLGLPDRFVEHGTPEQQLADCGLDFEGMLSAIRARLPAAGQPERVAKARGLQ